MNKDEASSLFPVALRGVRGEEEWKMNTGTRCKHCGETYGMHGVGDECPTVYAHFEQEDAKLFTAAARAREAGRREAEAKFWPIFMWLLGYTDWPERKPGEGAYHWRGKLRRDLENTITDFAALLAEKEDVDE